MAYRGAPPTPLSAVARGKVPRAARGEDLITSIVLGTLYWLPHDQALLPLIRQARPARPWEADPLEVQSLRFWPWWDEHDEVAGAEPDAVLTLHRPNARPLLIVIEAKHEAGKSGHGDQDQLLRQYASGLEIARRGELDFGGVVYLTSHLAMPRDEIAASGARIRATLGETALLYWASWRDVMPLLEAMPTSADPLRAALVRDLLEALDRLGFQGFRGWKSPPPTPAWSFRRAWPFAAQHVTEWHFKDFTGFSPIPPPPAWTAYPGDPT